MGTTSVAQALPSPSVATPPLYIISEPRRRADHSMAGSVPGWYYDPDDQAVYRYWDGEEWTDHCSDLFSAQPPEVSVN